MCIQETKLRKIGKIKGESTKNYVFFELTRKKSHGGGLATSVKLGLDPVFISEGEVEQVEYVEWVEQVKL